MRKMKFKTLAMILFLILPALVMAQDGKPRPIDVVKIALVVRGESPHQEELDKLLRSELDALRSSHSKPIDIVFVSHGANYDIQIAVMSLAEAAGALGGYAGAMLATGRPGWQEMSIYAAKDLQSLAQQINKTLVEKTFNRENRE